MRLYGKLSLLALILPLLASFACGGQVRNLITQNSQATNTVTVLATSVPATPAVIPSSPTIEPPTPAVATAAPAIVPTVAQNNDDRADLQDLSNSLNSLAQANQSDDTLDNLP
jgi:hypothetical protein